MRERLSDRFSFARIRRCSSRNSSRCAATALTFAMIVGRAADAAVVCSASPSISIPRTCPPRSRSPIPGTFARSIVAALKIPSYFDISRATNSSTPKARRTAGEGQGASSSSRFRWISPATSCAARNPQLLIEADATDPAAASYALGAFSQLATERAARTIWWAAGRARNGPPPFEVVVHRLYNPESSPQYNIVPGLMAVILTMTMVTDHLHGADARARARHAGKPARHAGTSARGHARQDHALSSWSATSR